jgi:hypothetical protein
MLPHASLSAFRPRRQAAVRVDRPQIAYRRLRLSSRDPSKGFQMLDIVLLALGLGFFALTILYAFACDRL